MTIKTKQLTLFLISLTFCLQADSYRKKTIERVGKELKKASVAYVTVPQVKNNQLLYYIEEVYHKNPIRRDLIPKEKHSKGDIIEKGNTKTWLLKSKRYAIPYKKTMSSSYLSPNFSYKDFLSLLQKYNYEKKE